MNGKNFVDNRDHFEIYNDTDSDCPAGGVCMFAGGVTENGVLLVVQPDADSLQNLVVTNFFLPARSTGSGTLDNRVILTLDPAGGPCADGNAIGSQAGSFLAKKGKTGFVCVGGSNGLQSVAARVAPVPPAPPVARWKEPVLAATTAGGTLATAFEGGDALDGVTLAAGDRILIKNQSSASENGIYTVNSSGAPTRATDADAGVELPGAAVVVLKGTANADTIWLCTTDPIVTLGTTALNWVRFPAGASVAAVTGSPAYTGIYSWQFATANLFVLSNPSPGVVRVDLGAAASGFPGYVSTTNQTFSGAKTIEYSDGGGGSVVIGPGITISGTHNLTLGGQVKCGTVQVGSATDYTNVLFNGFSFTSSSPAGFDSITYDGVRLTASCPIAAGVKFAVVIGGVRSDGITDTCTVKVGGVDKTLTIKGGLITGLA